MIRKLHVIALATWMLGLGHVSVAQEVKLDTEKARRSYAIGLNFGQRIKGDGLDLDLDVLKAAIKDGMTGAKSRLSDDELNEVLKGIEQEMIRRAQDVAKQNLKDGREFLEKNKKRKGVVTLESGLQYEILKAGEGESPKVTDTVTTHYHGTLIDGTVFDSSVQRGRPATFRVGQVIRGWTEALQLMKVGEKRKLYIPSELAYGPQSPGGAIGPNSVLIFEVELISIEE